MKDMRPVVYRDRSRKARKIEAVLAAALGGPVRGYRILDIGCGNGGISSHFARDNEQHGVDVADRRRDGARGFDFRLVDSERLPFEAGSFDIVISHHVIEHVADQGMHLAEIRRVLKPGGLAYLATPNGASPIMQGHVGNEMVLRYGAMAPLFERHGFAVDEYAIEVLKAPGRFHEEVRWGRFLPRFLLKLLRPLFPSQVFVLTPVEGREAAPARPCGEALALPAQAASISERALPS